MGNGIKPSGGPSGPPITGPVDQANVDAPKLDDAKVESQPAPQPKTQPPPSNKSAQKLEQRMDGTARQAQLQGQLQAKMKPGESKELARKILENPKLSDQAKMAELQKMLGKTDKAELARFLSDLPLLSDAHEALARSAILESPQLMGRIGSELPQDKQLDFIRKSVLNQRQGANEKEEKARLERVDKGLGEWMRSTDTATLNKALEGRTFEDVKVSGKLFAAMASDPAGLVMRMGLHQGKLWGDNLEIAMQVMNAALNPGAPATRDGLESMATGMILRFMQEEAKREGTDRRMQ